MRFLYKIYSGNDGFAPRRLPERLVDGHYLWLGWDRYLDAVDAGDQVWVYFHGPHRFEPGVYVRGFVDRTDYDGRRIRLRVVDASTDALITDAAVSRLVAEQVAKR